MAGSKAQARVYPAAGSLGTAGGAGVAVLGGRKLWGTTREKQTAAKAASLP